MAKGVGLDAGEFEVKVVELDGSYRKPRLTKAHVDRVSQISSMASNPAHATNEATALQHAVKSASIGRQNVCLGFSSREALFRQLHVPFTGEERIRKVIKFEAEGEIHSQSVDDMVIDFHIVEELDGETRVLVAGVPKAPLRTTLQALEKVGIEPERIDLDAMGLYRLADWAGVLKSGPLEEGAEPGPRSRIVLDIGARGVIVLVVTNGQLLDMRAVPLGCDSIAEDLAKRFGVDLELAREAMIYCLTTGGDYDATRSRTAAASAATGDAGGGDAGGGLADRGPADGGLADADEEIVLEDDSPAEEVQLQVRPPVIPVDVVVAARDRFLARLRREFMRFLVAVKGVGQIEAAFTTGAGSLLPGIRELLADVFGSEPQRLTFMHLLQHDLDADEAEYMEPRIAVAVGLALGHMNGVKGFNFRQEDLVYTRGFDRIKLPLAIACMLTLFYLFFQSVGLRKQLVAKEIIYGFAQDKEAKGASTRRQTGDQITSYKQFSGFLGQLVNDGSWSERTMPHNEYRAMVNKLGEQPTFDRLHWYRDELKRYLKKVQKKGQYEPTLELDSGVAVLQEFAALLDGVHKSLGRYYISEIDLTLPASERGRHIDFRVLFRGPDFRDRNAILERAIRNECENKQSAFDSLAKPPIEDPVTGDEVGGYYAYSVVLKKSIPVLKLKETK